MDNDFFKDIDNYLDLEPQMVDKLPDDTLICECFCVSVADIRSLTEGTKDIDLSFLKQQTSMGSSCKSCIKSFKSWVDKI